MVKKGHFFTLKVLQSAKRDMRFIIIFFRIIYNSPPNGIVNSGGYIPRDAKRREMYLALFCTESKGDSNFRSYQITELNKNEIVRLCYINSLAA